jgi:beta-galactosidase
MRSVWHVLRCGFFATLAIAATPLTRGALAAPSAAAGQAGVPALLLGAAWYPEQWPESRWDTDLELMEQAHLHVVRVGEFAWSTLEPSEGHYELDWLERAVRLAEKHHIAVVIGTPTDAPPAWLTTAHPDTLRVDSTGRRAEHGGRRQFNYASAEYRLYCADIAKQLATRFGHDPNVIGWQIGNEFTDDSFDRETRRQFDVWLMRKYGTLDALNRDWTTAYWSQTYESWSEIALPLPGAGGNPGLLLDYKHFVSDTWRGFEQVQLDAIRQYADPRQFVTTNLGGLGWSDNFDHYEITAPLSMAAWDDYVGEGHLNVARNGAIHDYVRGWKRANFWVMETQPGSVNWAAVNTALDPGETRAMAWQAIGHGADAVLYWQWRAALNGQEQYHGAIVGPDGGALPIYSEIRDTGGEFERAAQSLEGTKPKAQVAILTTYDSRWAIDFQPHNKNYDQLEVLLGYYRPLRDLRLTVDIVDANSTLNGYKLIFAPDLNVISRDLSDHLRTYVEHGGHLVLGLRSGMKDEHDALNVERQPGPLADTLGGHVEQYYALDAPVPVSGSIGAGTASLWAEQLSTRDHDDRAHDNDVPLRYGKSDGWLDGQPAMIERPVGSGRIAYLGAVLDAKLMRRVIASTTDEAQVEPEFGVVPAGVEVCRRVDEKHAVFVLINHNLSEEGGTAAHVKLPAPMKDLLHDGRAVTSVDLAPQGVAVVERVTP